MKEFRSSREEESTINLSDLSLIQSFFSNYKTCIGSKKSELEIINNMESVLALYLVENYSRKKGLKTTDFVLNSMVEFNKKLSRLRHGYDSKLGGYEVFSVGINPETYKKLQNEKALERTVKKKPQDIAILCEVAAYQQNSKRTCLLATVDYNDFLSNSEVIESLIGVKCVDPIYMPNEFDVAPR